MSWFKDLFFENEISEEREIKSEEAQEIKPDYILKIFDIVKKSEMSSITEHIIKEKSIALVKMHRFVGNREDLKEVLNELKKTCELSNSKIIGLTNNLYFITKNSISIDKSQEDTQ